MPPSRCCTVLRLDSTARTPGATTALFSGAKAAQRPNTPNVTKIIAKPMNATRRYSWLGGRFSFRPTCAWCGTVGVIGGRPPASTSAGRVAFAEVFDLAVLHDQDLIGDTQKVHFVGHEDDGRLSFELHQGVGQRLLTVGVQVGVGLVEDDERRAPIDRSRKGDPLTLAP